MRTGLKKWSSEATVVTAAIAFLLIGIAIGTATTEDHASAAFASDLKACLETKSADENLAACITALKTRIAAGNVYD